AIIHGPDVKRTVEVTGQVATSGVPVEVVLLDDLFHPGVPRRGQGVGHVGGPIEGVETGASFVGDILDAVVGGHGREHDRVGDGVRRLLLLKRGDQVVDRRVVGGVLGAAGAEVGGVADAVEGR